MNQPNIQKISAVSAVFVAMMVSGCQTTAAPARHAAMPVTQPAYDANSYPPHYPTSPAALPPMPEQPMPQPIGYIPGNSLREMAELEGTLSKMDERLQRVEKAMLRLDRRMQLVERNELNRMTGDENAPTKRRTSTIEDFSAVPVAAPGYTEGFQPVSTAITSSLQAAPSQAALQAQTGFQLASLASAPSAGAAGLASLADDRAVDTRPSADGDLAIWTVRFAETNVWPDRNQLPGSRDVVNALRSGQPVTVFARGKQPNAVLFRDRVKAISRYLGKVSGQDSVPIAALPSSHLDDTTIEIFATY